MNNDLEQRQLSLTLKGQFTPQDTVYLQVKQYEANGGDLNQYYNPTNATRGFRMNEDQTPIVSLGYHHEWSPGVHTLFLVTRLDDTTSFTNFTQPSLFEDFPDIGGVPTFISAQNITTREHFTRKLEIYSGELQQIWEGPSHNTIVGARIQYGHFDTTTLQTDPLPLGITLAFTNSIAAQQDITSLFKRISFYGYHQWQILEPLQLIGGLTYDRITFPENSLLAPISNQEKTMDKISPKAGLIWVPADKTTIRFAYTRSLAGASLDQSYQIEPSQVAGFVQSFRSIIPESIAGANAGAEFETYDLSLEQKFRTGTYLGISGEILNSTVHRVAGVFQYYPYELDEPVPSGLRENLDYDEKSLLFTANQLLGREWSLGARYRLSQAVLNDNFPDVRVSPSYINKPIIPSQRTAGLLQQLSLSAIYNHPCGFFAQEEAQWYGQSNSGYTPGEPGADFWQFNVFVGYRFPRRKAEITLGLLNLADQNYNLNPLNLYNELPRSRTLALRLQLSF
ncbi:MAG TPA: TonB-dependent receptor [Sedimentisphaerales bacterium]